MRSHLRYLRYVLLHKLYVFAAGVALKRTRANPVPFINRPLVDESWPRWLWRLLVHDASKFRPSEWQPYAVYFYGEHAGHQKSIMQGFFDRAWLLHIHRNPHHWQHWILHEDSGKTKVLLPESWFVDEMVADWIGAGTKILHRPTLAECVAETVTWYVANRQHMLLRDAVRNRVEESLVLLSARYGLVTAALEIRAAEQARASLLIPTR